MKASLAKWMLAAFACSLAVPGPAFGEYQPKGKRDPFVALVTPDGMRVYPPGLDEEVSTAVSDLSLQGILYEPNAQSLVIINGEVLEEQEELDGIKILKIEPTSVTVLVDGKTSRLTLVEPAKENQGEEP
jgi:hypothetical protein